MQSTKANRQRQHKSYSSKRGLFKSDPSRIESNSLADPMVKSVSTSNNQLETSTEEFKKEFESVNLIELFDSLTVELTSTLGQFINSDKINQIHNGFEYTLTNQNDNLSDFAKKQQKYNIIEKALIGAGAGVGVGGTAAGVGVACLAFVIAPYIVIPVGITVGALSVFTYGTLHITTRRHVYEKRYKDILKEQIDKWQKAVLEAFKKASDELDNLHAGSAGIKRLIEGFNLEKTLCVDFTTWLQSQMLTEEMFEDTRIDNQTLQKYMQKSWSTFFGADQTREKIEKILAGYTKDQDQFLDNLANATESKENAKKIFYINELLKVIFTQAVENDEEWQKKSASDKENLLKMVESDQSIRKILGEVLEAIVTEMKDYKNTNIKINKTVLVNKILTYFQSQPIYLAISEVLIKHAGSIAEAKNKKNTAYIGYLKQRNQLSKSKMKTTLLHDIGNLSDNYSCSIIDSLMQIYFGKEKNIQIWSSLEENFDVLKERLMTLNKIGEIIKKTLIIPILLKQKNWVLLYFKLDASTAFPLEIKYFDPRGQRLSQNLADILLELYPKILFECSHKKIIENDADSGPLIIDAVNCLKRGCMPQESIEMNDIRAEQAKKINKYGGMKQGTLKFTNFFQASDEKSIEPVEKSQKAELKNRNDLYTLDKQIKLPHLRLDLGKAIDDGCFFDSLAQSLNELQDSDQYDEKILRGICHQFYNANKELVDQWNKQDKQHLLQENEYYLIQYTKAELTQNFNNQAPLRGRPAVEGVMLCKALNLPGILVIEIFSDMSRQPVIDGYKIDKESYKRIANDNIDTILADTAIPKIAVSQNSLHFAPIIRSKLFYSDEAKFGTDVPPSPSPKF